jgi:hypothetical protein
MLGLETVIHNVCSVDGFALTDRASAAKVGAWGAADLLSEYREG